jgi:hypothetical protein
MLCSGVAAPVRWCLCKRTRNRRDAAKTLGTPRQAQIDVASAGAMRVGAGVASRPWNCAVHPDGHVHGRLRQYCIIDKPLQKLRKPLPDSIWLADEPVDMRTGGKRPALPSTI